MNKTTRLDFLLSCILGAALGAGLMTIYILNTGGF